MKKLPETLLNYLQPVYGAESQRIKCELQTYINSFAPVTFMPQKSDWYKNMLLYTVYPDSIKYDDTKSPFANLTLHIPHIKKLGCNSIYVLPFIESPLVDKGFDVSDHRKIRKDLGSWDEFLSFLKTAQKAELNLVMDFVANHVSEQHPWFHLAKQGNTYYQDFFYTTHERPHYLGKHNLGSAVFAAYEYHGEEILIDISFPEVVGEIPHWIFHENCWYYHTYYPQQLDLNWLNPNVFIEMAKVLIYWANLGFSFRLDAAPFIGKPVYKAVSKISHITYLLCGALKIINTTINPNAVLLIESFEALETIKQYFGSNEKPIADLAYNFHLNTQTWVSLVKKDSNYIWHTLKKDKTIPNHAVWLNFIRNHDELSLAHLDKNLTKELQANLLPLGANFREGHGVSGRTYSLLNNNLEKFKMSYFLLFSFPGSIMLTYGDEIAYQNIPLEQLSKEDQKDSRNINRGILYKSDFQSDFASNIFEFMRDLFILRNEFQGYFKQWPVKISNNPALFAANYQFDNKLLSIYINLSDYPQEIELKFDKIIRIVNNADFLNDKIILAPYAGVWLFC